MTNYGWLFDAKRCLQCHACEAACSQWNGGSPPAQFRAVRSFESGAFPNVRTQVLSLSCNHCLNASCVKVCPTKAMTRRPDGIIHVNKDVCVGCGLCSRFCPFGALKVDETNRKMTKCNMCAPRVDGGLQPACVSVCPTQALQWGPWAEIRQKGVDRTENFIHVWTSPAVRFITGTWKQS
jgi:anaerobic dimethyl sulfoxide reductase subunit B